MNVTHQYCYFYDDALFVDERRTGFRRRIIKGEHLELWFWRIADGAQGSIIHHHPTNEQLGMIVRGKIDFRIGAENDPSRVVLGAGDVYLAPKDVWHGDSIFIGDDELNEVWILDVFSPPRQDVTEK
jgi:quercetin dioxygenase-like cupin family protein